MPPTQPKQQPPGRPSQGLTEALTTHITPEVKTWLAKLVRTSGLREGELVRRIIDAARDGGWNPT